MCESSPSRGWPAKVSRVMTRPAGATCSRSTNCGAEAPAMVRSWLVYMLVPQVTSQVWGAVTRGAMMFEMVNSGATQRRHHITSQLPLPTKHITSHRITSRPRARR
jgi:hypothetical protein